MTFPLFRTLARRTRLLRNPLNQISGATWTSTSTTRASITTAKMVTTAEILKKAARPLEFPNKDQKFWWDATAHSLAELLARSGYTEEEQAAHLAWYRRFIPHTLGPRPVVGKPYTFVPGPVFDGSPVEHSINWKEKSKSKRLVRFTVGPASFEQADDQDPFSQDEVRRFLECQMDAVPGLSLERFNTVCENLFIKPENYASLIARIPDYTPRVQAWVAFDLVPTPMAKVYFVPMLKWLETGKTLNEIAFETTIACNTEKNGSFDGPVAFTKKYFDTFPVETRPRVEFMAIDCVDAPSSRVKHYVRTKANTFNKVVDLYTLGGSLKSEDIDAGIAALKELWPLIFRLDVTPEELGDAEVWPTGGPGAGAAIEMRPGQDEPEVKIHWPVRLINGTDEQLADSLATYFRQRGHGEFADNYKSDLKASFPGHDIENKNGTHTFVSFSWSKKTGVYMTMYYSTKIFDVEIPNWDREAQPVEDIWIHYGKLVNDPSYKRVPQ